MGQKIHRRGAPYASAVNRPLEYFQPDGQRRCRAAVLSDDRRLVRAEAFAEAEHLADALPERAEGLFDVARAGVVAVTLDVDAQRRARRARARQAQHRARAVFEEDAHALPRGRAAVHRVRVAELVGALDAAAGERRPGELRETSAQLTRHLGGRRGVEPLVVVPLVVAPPEPAPVVAHDLLDRLPRHGEDREPAQNRPQPILLAHVVRARAEALLAAHGREARVEQVAEELPPRRRLVTLDAEGVGHAVYGRARRHRARDAREPFAVAGDAVARVLGDDGQRVARRDEEVASQNQIAVAVAVAGRADVGGVAAAHPQDELG